MAASDAKPLPIKNTAFRVYFPILDNDGDPVTGAAGLDSEVSKDAGSFADCTNEATEISAGIYYLDLTSGEMNADAVVVQVKTSTTDAKTTILVFYPQEAGDIPVDVQSISGDATAADNLEAMLDSTGGVNITLESLTIQGGYNAVTLSGSNLGLSISGSVAGIASSGSGGPGFSGSITGDVTGNLSGSVGSVTGAVGSVTGNVGGNVTGSVGSVIGAVGSVTGNVGGNVVGSVASVTNMVTANVTQISGDSAAADNLERWFDGTVGFSTSLSLFEVSSFVCDSFSVNSAMTLNAFSVDNDFAISGDLTVAGAIISNITGNLSGSVGSVTGDIGGNITLGVDVNTINGLVISDLADITARLLTATELDGSVYRFTTNALEQAPGGSLTAAAVADAVWDEAIADHATAGSTGAALSAAGSAGDPWITALPGAYAAGTAGAIIGTTLPGLLTGATVEVIGPVADDGTTITLRKGDDYLQAIGTHVQLTVTGRPYSFVGASGTIEWSGNSIAIVVTSATQFYFQRTATETNALTSGTFPYEVNMTLSGGQKVTPVVGSIIINRESSPLT